MQDKIMNMQLPLSQMSEIQAQINLGEPMQIAPNTRFAGASERVDFGQIIASVVKEVDQSGRAASAKMEAVDMGASDDLVGAMVASQKASLSFAAMVQVRNKLLTAYDDVMRMPV
ncbi:flagellar hook-basal body complex protein FliE [Photobacterium aphoticum]|uniref:Flagellar hook-basal body complex protein FliE n=1 Tax=Photobacterium aphoticum TaxID=754436 RepID=A0A0J1GMG0_9GAMM|nr:flagellar hook-basal body complex protein FliE [Photobacterium aphoticum]KLV00634.1 flagellar basal body protein FliE [Photobacterium aphoticum]PSU51937.1 flagellar hook-basal body complex protein FliE [Photobacterium aphoticum]